MKEKMPLPTLYHGRYLSKSSRSVTFENLLQAGDPALTLAAEAANAPNDSARGGLLAPSRGGLLDPDFGGSLPSRGFGGPQAGR